ncbi:hypothetical protein [Pectobacterium aroidearum]|uniref:hypothetical protein n=1 Tax=Pectobacterium aroidearum TaxID=1201031 RepID=UPI003019B6AD
MKKNFLALVTSKNFWKLSDRAISMVSGFVFILLAKGYSDNPAFVIKAFFWGAIFGYLISFNQEYNIKAKNYNSQNIILASSFSTLILLAAYFIFTGDFFSAIVFAMSISGRGELLRYDNEKLLFQLPNIVTSIVVFILIFFSAYASHFNLSEIYKLYVFFYPFVKLIFSELSLCSYAFESKKKNNNFHFSTSLALSGLLSTSANFGLPLLLNSLGGNGFDILYYYLWFQRAISPAQQVGMIISKPYIMFSEARKYIQKYAIVSVLAAAIILSVEHVLYNTVSAMKVTFIFIIAYFATYGGSWTISAIAENKAKYEFYKILLAMLFAVISFYFLSVKNISPEEKITITIFIYNLFIYFFPLKMIWK